MITVIRHKIWQFFHFIIISFKNLFVECSHSDQSLDRKIGGGRKKKKISICLRFPFHDITSATQEVLLSCGRFFPLLATLCNDYFDFHRLLWSFQWQMKCLTAEGQGTSERLRGDSEYTWLHQTSSRREKWGISGVKRTPEKAKELGQTQACL